MIIIYIYILYTCICIYIIYISTEILITKIFKSEKDFWCYNGGMKDNRPGNLDGDYAFSSNTAYETIYAKDLA